MNSLPKISIIVPVYNTEKYLRQCLQSLADQTLREIEVLVVNNNTPDQSQKIIDEFAAKDSRFKAIFRKDGMLGGARNAGLQQATGEYVLFVDSDDWISPRLCQTLWDIAQKENADIVDTTGLDVAEDGQPLRNTEQDTHKPDAVYHGQAKEMMLLARDNSKPWGKIIRRCILADNHLWFPENRAHEDIAFISACFVLSHTFAKNTDNLYYYRHVPKSLSRSNLHLMPERLFANFIPVRQMLKEKGIYPQVAPEFEYHLVHMIIGGENAGRGSLKYMSAQDIASFASQAGRFFDTLPPGLFKQYKPVFRLKFFVFRLALRRGWYSLPRAMKPLYALVDICTSPFAGKHA